MPRGSKKIQVERRKRGLTQKKLAEYAGVSRRVLQKAEQGLHDVSDSILHLLADELELAYEDVIASDEEERGAGKARSPDPDDAFQVWPWSLSDFIHGTAVPSPGAFCRSAEDATRAIQAMRENWTTHLERTSYLSDSDVFAEGNDQINREYQRYEERYAAIWKANPHTILYSTVGEDKSGLCVVLPVTREAYRAMRKGERSFMEIEASDVLRESQYLILDSAAEIRCDGELHWNQVTNSLSFTLFYLISLLSENPVASSFRMLGFGASQTNLERLSGIGFSPCGVEMPRFKYQVCEFGLDASEHSEDALKRSLTTLHYANLFKIFSLTEASLSEKQRMIRRALRLYQRTAKRYADRRGGNQDGSAA